MFCNDSNLTTDLVTDGNKGVGKSAIFLGKCDSVAYIDVLLEALYFVHYVVVTEGKEVEELGVKKLNFFDWLSVLDDEGENLMLGKIYIWIMLSV